MIDKVIPYIAEHKDLFIGAGLFFLFCFAIQRNKSRRAYRIVRNTKLQRIDRMTGTEFEEYLCNLYISRGYRVKHTGKSGDFGCDLLLSRNGHKTAIQAKRYSSPVGVKAIQEVYGAKGYYGTEHCAVITNSYFTSAAKKLADKLGVQLIDRSQLISYINQIQKKKGVNV